MNEVIQASSIGTASQDSYNGCNITINLTIDADEFIINELFKLFRKGRLGNKTQPKGGSLHLGHPADLRGLHREDY